MRLFECVGRGVLAEDDIDARRVPLQLRVRLNRNFTQFSQLPAGRASPRRR